MSEEFNRENAVARLNALVGQPYEPPDGCLKFLRRALLEIGVEIEGVSKKDAKKFRRVDGPSFGTVVVFKNVKIMGDESEFHVGLMLDKRWAVQSSRATAGVGRIEITRHPWVYIIKGFYRPRKLD